MALRELGIPAMGISSLTPKDDVTAAYKQMEADTGTLLVYGALHSFLVPALRLLSWLCSNT